MMRLSRPLISMLMPLTATVLMTGCAAEPVAKPAAAPMIMPASPEQAVDLQAQFMKLKPNARVGHVSAVNGTAGEAAIAGIPIGEVHIGDSVQFIDAKFHTFANGTVMSSDATHPEYPFLIVDYKAIPTGRTPITGDLVVYLPS